MHIIPKLSDADNTDRVVFDEAVNLAGPTITNMGMDVSSANDLGFCRCGMARNML